LIHFYKRKFFLVSFENLNSFEVADLLQRGGW